MAEILKEWLTARLQRPIKWEAQEFGNIMKNGHIVASVLYSYNVINEEKLFLIRANNASVDVKSNWKYLSAWLREVDVHLSETELANIMEGKGSALLRLFYQLFLHLDKRDRTDFIKRERKMVSALVDKIKNRFEVKAVKEESQPPLDYLSKPLTTDQHFVEWQKKKVAEIKDTYDFVKLKYKRLLNKDRPKPLPCWEIKPPKPKKLTSKEKRDMYIFGKRHPEKFENYTYEQLLELEEANAARGQSFIDSEWAKNYMEDLDKKLGKRSESEDFQKEIRNILSNALWDASVGAEETKNDKNLAKKVMKLSQFEKQMCTQVMETKQQARNLAKNRIDAEREYAQQRDHMFNQFLDNVKEQIHLEVIETDYEKRRQNKLHKVLYAEKIKRKRQHYYEICYDTMLALVDYAVKLAFWTRLLANDVPEHFIHEWKLLFFRHQPIFDILDPMEELLEEHGMEEELVREEEEIVRLELDRQDILNDAEFLEYHNYAHPWTLDMLLPNYDNESDEKKYEYLGTRILGHVVYKLLEIKYPYPPPRPPADLPPFMSKAVVRNLPDKSIAIPMQTLLNLSKIHVVRVECAVNYCLREFKNEMVGCNDIDLSYDKFIAAAPEEEGKTFIRTLKTEDENYSKSSDITIAAILLGPIPPNCKSTQTPKVLPEEDMSLSLRADLGRYAYEALSFGDTLTDHLIAAMLVEYIKSQKDINGFVLINYPNTYRETQILEETFSGREPPDEAELYEDKDDIYLEDSIEKHRKKEKDPYKEIRVSKIVNNPHIIKSDLPFESYFTCYLRLQETEDILQEYIIWDLNEENSELIDRFYAALGLNYSLYYEVIERDLLAQICKYIIGDLTLPPKSSSYLFGEGVLSILEFPTSEDRRMKSKMVKPDVSLVKSKDKLKRMSRTSGSTSNQEMEVVKVHDESTEETIERTVVDEAIIEEDIKTISTVEVVILAGEEDWVYGDLPIPEGIGRALATCWEEVEKAYVHDMEQLFFSKRLQMNCIVPYCRFIKDKMDQIITLPSFKQDLVSRFQKEYNEFEDDWRPVNLCKNEWHCRIKDLQTRLYNICDERKIYAEQQRMSIIHENWTAIELTTMTNTYISCMQAELNRSILTFQTLHDFYYCMLKKMPPNERLQAKDLNKITKEAEESGSGRKPQEDKQYKVLKAAFQDMQTKNIQLDYHNNPVNMILENDVRYAMKLVKDTNDHYRSVISREYSEIAKIQPVPPKKDETLSPSSVESINLEEIYKMNALKCVDEWLMGVNGEMYRLNQRLFALHYKCLRDMKLFHDTVVRAFQEIQNDINNYYMNEIKAVDRLCKYLQMAVENGVKIPETLILEHDTFLIDPNLLQFEPPSPPPDSGIVTEQIDMMVEFKMSQLVRLRTQLKIVAPTGIALQQAFIFLLQDFIFFGKESCDGPLFPEIFRRIDPEKVPKLVFLLFGETAYVDWRDFLIYCLNIRFPNVEELLSARKMFRCDDKDSTELVSRYDFIRDELWFEKEFDPNCCHAQLRKNLIKHFLVELFETSEDNLNYSAFLLAFSKSTDPIEGFANALAMAVGKKIGYLFEECEGIVCKLVKEKQYRDECLACAYRCAKEFIEKLITRVVNICEAISIEEMKYEPKSDIISKGKPGKNKKEKESKAATAATQSARQTGKKGVGQVKNARSASEVKLPVQVFICPPCEPAAVLEEKPVKEEVEEEHKPETTLDPNVTYAVPQHVIWNVLRICLPWHFALVPDRKPTPYEERVKAAMDRLAVNTDNGDIYISQFVLDPYVCKMLHKVKKFTALNLIEELSKVCMNSV